MLNLPTVPLHVLALSPVVIGAFCFFLPRRILHTIAIVTNIVVIVLAVSVFMEVRSGTGVVELVAGWPEGISIRLVADELSAPLVVLSSVFVFLTLLFTTREHFSDNTFIFLIMLLESTIIASFLSGDVFNVYVLLELGMLVVAILIMYERERQSVYDGIFYIMMNFIAMAFMILGIGYLYRATGVLDFMALHSRIETLPDPKSVVIPYAMIMTALTMKAALFPLFGWLPRAHGAPSAPSIVSAILSGVQVKVGVYLLVRMHMVFLPAIDASAFFAVIGFITAVVGFALAVAQKDIKLILAYHTVSQIGLIVLGLNLGSEVAYWGGMLHIINHALFKGLLFLTAGVIIEHYGTRHYTEIRGVLRQMPVIGIATLAGVLGITGAPFFNGSISKYFIQQGLEGDMGSLAMYLINFGTLLSFVKYSTILFGRPTVPAPVRRDPFIAGVSLVFGTACLLGGVFGGAAVSLVFDQHYSVEGAYSLEKITTFIITLGLGVIVYRMVVPRIGGVLEAVRDHRFNFSQVTMVLTAFFAALLSFAYLTT